MNICRCLLAALFFFTTSAWAELAKVVVKKKHPLWKLVLSQKALLLLQSLRRSFSWL